MQCAYVIECVNEQNKVVLKAYEPSTAPFPSAIASEKWLRRRLSTHQNSWRRNQQDEFDTVFFGERIPRARIQCRKLMIYVLVLRILLHMESSSLSWASSRSVLAISPRRA